MLFIGNKAVVIKGRAFGPSTPTNLSDVTFTPEIVQIVVKAVADGLISPLDKEANDLLGLSNKNNAQFSTGAGSTSGGGAPKYWDTVDNMSIMVALPAKNGDWCIRLDSNSAWFLVADDPTMIDNWVEIPAPRQGGQIVTPLPIIEQAYAYATPANGFNLTVPPNCSDYQIHAAGTLATGTVKLPNSGTIPDGFELVIGTSFAITAFTLALNGGQFANPANAPTTMAAGATTKWKWYGAGVNLWVRRG